MPRVEPTLEMCSTSCGARCCRAPLVMSMTRDEAVQLLEANPEASRRAVARVNGELEHDPITGAKVGAHNIILDFSEQEGEHCPFLAPESNTCTVYDVRPSSCRDFPNKPMKFCLAWTK